MQKIMNSLPLKKDIQDAVIVNLEKYCSNNGITLKQFELGYIQLSDELEKLGTINFQNSQALIDSLESNPETTEEYNAHNFNIFHYINFLTFVRPMMIDIDVYLVDHINLLYSQLTETLIIPKKDISCDASYLQNPNIVFSNYCTLIESFDANHDLINKKKEFVKLLDEYKKNTSSEFHTFKVENMVFDNFNGAKNPFYYYLIENNVVDPYDAFMKTRELFSYMNQYYKHQKNDTIGYGYLGKYDLPIKTEASDNVVDRIVKPFIYDTTKSRLIIVNYKSSGLHHSLLEYFTNEGYDVTLIYKNRTIHYGHSQNEKTNKILITCDADSSCIDSSEKANKKVISIFHSFSISKNAKIENSESDYEKIYKYPNITLADDPNIFNNIFTHVAKYDYGHTGYDDKMEKYINEYIEKYKSDFDAILNKIHNKTEETIKEFRKSYDDSETQIVEKFLTLVKSHFYNYHLKSPLSALIYGPAGTGKTHFATTLAKTVYGSKDKCFVVSLSQNKDFSFFETETFGASKAYIGSESKTRLQKFIGNNLDTGGVILVDECDKPKGRDAFKFLDSFLNVLNDGKIDFKGQNQDTFDVKKFIFIFCGNYNISRQQEDDTQLKNVSPAFMSRMKTKFVTKQTNNKLFMINAILNDVVEESVRMYDKLVKFDLRMDKSILDIPEIKQYKLNGREISKRSKDLFSDLIYQITMLIIKERKTKIEISYKNDALIVNNE